MHEACSKGKQSAWNQKSLLNLAHSSQLVPRSHAIFNRIPPCLGARWFSPPGRRSNWGWVSIVFAVGDQAILPWTAKHPPLCPQPGKHFDRGLQQESSDELCDLNFDYDDPFVNGNLFVLYSKLGITEHEMREDIYDNVADSTIVGSPPVSSCCSLVNSCTQGPVHLNGCLKNHLGFWQRIKANRWVISVIRDSYALPFIGMKWKTRTPLSRRKFLSRSKSWNCVLQVVWQREASRMFMLSVWGS